MRRAHVFHSRFHCNSPPVPTWRAGSSPATCTRLYSSSKHPDMKTWQSGPMHLLIYSIAVGGREFESHRFQFFRVDIFRSVVIRMPARHKKVACCQDALLGTAHGKEEPSLRVIHSNKGCYLNFSLVHKSGKPAYHQCTRHPCQRPRLDLRFTRVLHVLSVQPGAFAICQST